MNTPAHLILGAAIFARPDAYKINLAALTGAFLPDFSLYFMVFWNSRIRGMSSAEIFDEQYFSSYWQDVFAVDNSIPLWSLAFCIGLILRSPILFAFTVSGLLHLFLDFPLHHDDGRAHFWPFSDWIFQSPFSYWDIDNYGGIFGPVEGIICIAMLVLLWRRFSGKFARCAILFAGLLEFVPAILFPLLFAFD